MTLTDFFCNFRCQLIKMGQSIFLKPNWISLSAPASVGGVGGAICSSNFFGLADAAHWYDFRLLSLSDFFYVRLWRTWSGLILDGFS